MQYDESRCKIWGIMPLTKDGKKVLAQMQKKYGKERGKRIFYASINKGVKGSEKWHR